MSNEPNKDDPVLCYVDNNCAYFTTQALDKQWGDDWNDAPYEHNAGTPYEAHESDLKAGKTWSISQVFFDANFETPDANQTNSRWSVKTINAKHIAWLSPCTWQSEDLSLEPIWAGTTMSEFKSRIKESGGKVFVEEV